MKLQYTDHTGNVNLRMYTLGYQGTGQPGVPNPGSAQGHISGRGDLMNKGSNSAHGMIQPIPNVIPQQHTPQDLMMPSQVPMLNKT
jgi:hypothetical protein